MEERTDSEQIIDEIAELKLTMESMEAGIEFILKAMKENRLYSRDPEIVFTCTPWPEAG